MSQPARFEPRPEAAPARRGAIFLEFNLSEPLALAFANGARAVFEPTHENWTGNLNPLPYD